MRNLIRRLLPHVARLHPSNWRESRHLYPQTWWLVPGRRNRNGFLYRCITATCGFLTGHELSATEKGYGGGVYMDCNCRWCDKGIQVPLAECEMSPHLRELVERFRGDTLEGNGDELTHDN